MGARSRCPCASVGVFDNGPIYIYIYIHMYIYNIQFLIFRFPLPFSPLLSPFSFLSYPFPFLSSFSPSFFPFPPLLSLFLFFLFPFPFSSPFSLSHFFLLSSYPGGTCPQCPPWIRAWHLPINWWRRKPTPQSIVMSKPIVIGLLDLNDVANLSISN